MRRMGSANTLSVLRLSVRDLMVRRGERVLFADLSFAVEPGRALLLRGPNGAGKSTLLLALAGVVRPEAGTIDFGLGDEVAAETQMHLVAHRPAIKPRLTVGENLSFWREVNGGSGDAVEVALETVGIAPLIDLEAGYLSAGQTRRLSLARLLVSRRPLWLLDEPTSSLDVAGDALVGRLIVGHCSGGGMAVIATHDDIPALDPAGTETLVLGSA